MKANKKLVLGTVLTAAGVGAAMGTQDAKADSIYTVQSGDTLYKISRKFNVSMDDIAKANGLKDINMIYVNEQLTIPTDGNTKAAQPAPKVQAVKATPAQSNYSAQANQKQAAVKTTSQPAQTTYTAAPQQSASSSEEAAKAWIANRESGGSYSARNGQYIGKYQLSASYLNGDYSAANQERVANNYVQSRYGSWSAAKSFWQANGWY